MRSDRRLKAWYREINTRFFDNELPDNVCVKWGGQEEEEEDEHWEEKFNGYAEKLVLNPHHVALIVINNELRQNHHIKLAILVHEMIHISTDFRDDHGPAFERCRELIASRGIFKKGALLKGITLF